MTQFALPTGRSLLWRMHALTVLTPLPALAVLLACLFTLLELTREQWQWFVGAVGLYTLVFTGPIMAFQRRSVAPIVAWLERRDESRLEEEAVSGAFAASMSFPIRSAIIGVFNWLVPTWLICAAMELRWERWSFFDSAVVQFAGLAAGFLAGSFLLFLCKLMIAPVRNALAARIPDPAVRRSLVVPVSLRTKLLVSVSGVAILPVIFAVLLAHTEATRALRDFTIGWQAGMLDAARARLDSGSLDNRSLDNGSLDAGVLAAGNPDAGITPSASTAPGAGELPLPIEVGIVDLAAPLASPLGGKLEDDVLASFVRAIAEGETSGNTTRLRSAYVVSWRALPDRRILMALSPSERLRLDQSGLWTVFALLLVVSASVAGALAWLLAQDVSRATEALRGEAERLSSGDLRRGEVVESEDELGELSRSFEAMGSSLRATVARVSEAADRVEATAGEMAGVSEAVSSVTADQVRGIQQTTTSMEEINHQVRGIADSSQRLNVSVEESSSSILELGAAGEELNETALVLSGKVNEVSSSIEQMVRSVKQVLENTEALSEAAVETSSSMGEMATSMREVDVSAEETARLSDQVVASAESGQAKMVQTIEGMEAIREATETAERVIRNLGSRTREIGAIVDVIDDVADETNLLALNAAIIAAQAGEQGKAFSVVADEIKELADRVLASTKEIGGLIRAVQEEGSNAIGAIEKGAASVASGVDLSAEAGESLEEITRASRQSGTRIAGIVSAVREQARAAIHVVELMERVRGGVEQIRAAAAEQDRGNEVVHSSSVAMREVAQQVRGTTEEQTRGSGRIRESVEGVREAVEQINSALQEQSTACRSAVELLEGVYTRTRSNEESARRLDAVAKSLLHQAEALRQDVRRFEI
jgi:methyl-accepting chemotaxis protein